MYRERARGAARNRSARRRKEGREDASLSVTVKTQKQEIETRKTENQHLKNTEDKKILEIIKNTGD